MSKEAVTQWLKRARQQGPDTLKPRKGPEARPRLTAPQRAQTPTLLARGPEAYGFRGALWTEGRIAEVIRQEYGVAYRPAHVGRTLKTCCWTLQKPARWAVQRTEEAIRRRKEERWPVLKKGRGRTARHLQTEHSKAKDRWRNRSGTLRACGAIHESPIPVPSPYRRPRSPKTPKQSGRGK